MTSLDELHEVLGWILVALAVTGVATERLADWPGVVLIVVAVFLLVGAKRAERLARAVGSAVSEALDGVTWETPLGEVSLDSDGDADGGSEDGG